MKRKMRSLTGWGVVFGLLIYAGPIGAAEFPGKSIEILDPHPGGPTSMVLKFVADAATKMLGKPVLAVGTPGGVGVVAATKVAKAKPDGYTIFGCHGTSNGNALFLRKDLAYTNNDFEFLVRYAAFDLGLVVKPKAPYQTLEDYVAYAKKNPSAIKCATTGPGGTDHIASEFLALEARGMKVDYVPFKGPFEKRNAVTGGHVDSAFVYGGAGGPGDEFRQTLNGGGKILAATTQQRLKAYPDVPTFKEKGLNVVISAWYGIAGPKGMPREVSQKLKETFYKILKDPETVKYISNLGYRYAFLESEEFTLFVKENEKLVERVIKESGIVIQY